MPDSDTIALRLKGVGYAYGAHAVLENVCLTVPVGTFCALLGPNGAGKSTLFSLLTGLFTPKAGTIEIAGYDMSKAPRRALAKMGVVFQQTTLDLDLSVEQNLSYFAALHGMGRALAITRARDVLARMDMAERAKERVRDLNGGHRRRLEIARALMHQPQVLLLDEPTVGLDASTRNAITAHVHDLCENDGLAVLWATHLVDEVRMDDRLAILNKGRILADGVAGVLCKGRPLEQVFVDMTKPVQA